MTWIADIAPTLLEAAGGQTSEWTFDGISQWANWTGSNMDVHQYALGHLPIATFWIIKHVIIQFVRFVITVYPDLVTEVSGCNINAITQLA